MGSVNPVLTAANAYLTVTNYTGDNTSTTQQFPWVPLGTDDGTATGELGIKAIIVNTSSLAISTQPKQYSTASNFTVGGATTAQTVFTLAAGEKGYIRNLSGTAALAYKLGAGAATTAFSDLLAKGSANDDGLGAYVEIDDWVGAVSVMPMSGTSRYIAAKLS